jgi:four helix bundle protein
MQDFKDLKAWQKSHSMTLRTYAETAIFPPAELFGLTSQMRRAASSIPANIAEGCCHGGGPTFARHLRIALGSAGELEYYAILAGDLKFLSKNASTELIASAIEVKKILTGLLKAVRRELKTRN